MSDAEAALARIQLTGEMLSGDNFPFENTYTRVTRAEVRQVFGSSFADQLFSQQQFSQKQHSWFGPLLSGYGVHLVQLSDMEEAIAIPYDEIEETVLADWRKSTNERQYQRL